MESEKLSKDYWEVVPHSELPLYTTKAKTKGDINTLKRILKPADRILDLGCGWGRITCKLANRGYDVTGVDLSENLLAYAKQNAQALGLNLQFIQGSMLSVPYPEASFDKVICLWGVFNHLLTPEDQVKGLNEMNRVLEPGRLAFIEMGNGERKKYQQILATLGTGPDDRVWNSQYKKASQPNILYIHDRETLKRVIQKSKFEDWQVRFQNINHKKRIVAYLYKH